MSPVDRDVLGRLLLVLERNVARLRALGPTDPPSENLPEREWARERGIQLCIQGVLDIGAHILASHPTGPLDDYTAVLDGMVRLGVLSADLGSRMRPMPGLRNLLVHEYAAVDSARIREFAANRLSDFDDFLAAVLAWLRLDG